MLDGVNNEERGESRMRVVSEQQTRRRQMDLT